MGTVKGCFEHSIMVLHLLRYCMAKGCLSHIHPLIPEAPAPHMGRDDA